MAIAARLFAWCLILFTLASSLSAREWHSSEGRRLCKGKLLAVEAQTARILDDKGDVRSIPLERLSLDDLEHVLTVAERRRVLLAEGEAAVAAPADESLGLEAHSAQATQAADSAVEDAPLPADDSAFPLTDITNQARWQARPDPARWNWDSPVDEQRSAELPRITQSDFVLPETPSPYFAIASSRGEFCIWDRWDLRVGMPTGTARGVPRESSQAALSADGKWLAVIPRNSTWAEVWSFESGKRVSQILNLSRHHQAILRFVAADGVLVQTERERVAIYDATSGKLKASLPDGYYTSSSRLASSPGGHYLAISQSEGNRIGIIDTRNGAIAGEVRVPANLGRMRSIALGFSPAGAELWAVVQIGSSYRLFAWSLADGKQQVNLRLDYAMIRQLDRSAGANWPQTLDIMKFPQLEAVLLHGSHLLDTKSGGRVWEFGTGDDTNQSILRILGDRQMLIVRGRSNGSKLEVMHIPFREIEASRALVEAGGTSRDQGLPPLTVPDWSGIQRRQRIEASDGKYSAVPVQPAASTESSRRFGPRNGEQEVPDGRYAAFAEGKTLLCAMIHRSPAGAEGGPTGGSAVALDVFNLDSGERESRLALPRAVAPLDLAADGSQAVIATTNDWRVDIWDVKTGAHKIGLRPAGPQERLSFSGRHSSPYAKLVEPDRLLTAHWGDELVMWRLDELRPVYSLAIRPSTAVALDASRTYFLAQDEQGIHLCEAKDGTAVATLDHRRVPEDLHLCAASFRSDGQTVAMLLRGASDYHLVVWNISQDEVSCNMQLPLFAEELVWSGDDVMLGGVYPDHPRGSSSSPPFDRTGDPSRADYIRREPDHDRRRPVAARASILRISPTEQRVVWAYESSADPTRRATTIELVGQSAPNRAWLALRDRNKLVLRALAGRLPHEDEAIRKSALPARKTVAGNAIDLEIDIGPLPDVILRSDQRREELRRSLSATMKKRLDEYAVSTSAGEHLTIEVSMHERAATELLAPGGNMLLSAVGGLPQFRQGGGDDLGVLARIEFMANGNREPIWLTEAWFARHSRFGPAPSNVDASLRYLAPWERALAWLEQEPLPVQITDTSRFGAVGTTMLPMTETAEP